MNKRGMQELKPVPIRSGFDLLPGGGSEAQTLFDNHDRKVALERVRINAKKEQGMLGHLNTTARSQRYERPMSRSAVPNGVFHGSPMDYDAESGLRGGRIYTQEGQEWLAKRLLQRREEYSQLSSGNFSAGPAKKIDLSPFNNIDTLFQIAFTALTSGTLTGGLNDTLNQLLQAIIKAGAVITGRQLTRYAQAIQKMGSTADVYSRGNRERREDADVLPDEFNEAADVKQMSKLKLVQTTLNLISAAIREIARVIDQPPAARKQVMDTLASRLFGRQLEQYVARGEDVYPEMQFGQPTSGAVSRDILPAEPEAPAEEEMPDLEEEEYVAGLFGQGRLLRMHRF